MLYRLYSFVVSLQFCSAIFLIYVANINGLHVEVQYHFLDIVVL